MKGVSYLLVFLLLWLGLIPSAFAQKQNDDDQLKKADKLFEEGNYAEAYPMYAHLLSLSKGNVDITFKYGATLLYSSDNKSEAIPYLEKAAAKSITDTRVYYFLGKAYQLNYEFKKAITAYNDFKGKADSKSLADFDVEQVIRQCENGNDLLSNLNEVLVLDKKDVSSSEFFRYYELDNLGGKILLAPEEFQTSLDKKKGHRPVIYTAPLSNVVYFSSYGKNGNTGKDIYYATRRGDGTWSDPIKLPAPINSKYNEDYPFFHSDGKTFFFSSDGHNSMGGYDIFRSNYNPNVGSYSEPENLDFAINTPDDDLFYIADSLNQIAYFSSARASKQGRLDVYKVKVDLIPSNMIIIKGDFISEINPMLKDARVTIEDEQTKRQIAVIKTDKKGNYLVDFKAGGQYNFYVEAGGNGIIHTGRVEIPRLEYMAAFKQELIMINDNGTERLMIKNYFDTPLDDDMQELSAEILKRRALLDITPEAELDEKSITVEEQPVAVSSFNELYLTAGFASASSNEGIVKWVNESADELKKVNQEYRDLAGVAFRESKIYDQQASDKIIKAETTIRAYQYTEDTEKKRTLLKEAVELRVSAENDLISASAALMLANQLSASILKRELFIADMEQSGINVYKAIEEENSEEFEAEMVKLNEYNKELKSTDKGIADPITFIENVKEVEVNEKITLLDYAERLREEKNSTLALIRQLETQYENASKKDKSAISTQLEEAKNDLIDIEKENEAAWQNYRDQDWDAIVATKGVELAIGLDNQSGEAIPDQESIDRVMDHVEIQQQSLKQITLAEDAALIALGMSAEEVITSGGEVDQTIATSTEDIGDSGTGRDNVEKTMEEELITGYYDQLNEARSNSNEIDRLQDILIVKQQLLDVVNTEIESGESSYDEANLMTLRSDLTSEIELLTTSFVTALINQDSGFNEIAYYIPDYEEKLDEINNSNLTDLEKTKARSDYLNEVSTRLNAILYSISSIPIEDIEFIVELRTRMEDENSLRANIAWVDGEQYNLNQELTRQSDVVMSAASEEELINSVYPAYESKRAQMDNSSLNDEERSTQLIQLNESLIAKIDGQLAEFNAEKYTATEEELLTIDAEIVAYNAIKDEKEEEITEAVGILALASASTTSNVDVEDNSIADEPDVAVDDTPIETEPSAEAELANGTITTIEAESWNTMLSSIKTEAALALWINNDEISTDPGFTENMPAANEQLQQIEELNLLKKQKRENEIALATADKKEAKKLEKEQVTLNTEIIAKESELLEARIPLVISETNDRLSGQNEISDRSASEAYLLKANNLLTLSDSKEGEEKLGVLKQAYQLSLMSLQEAGYTTLSEQAGIAALNTDDGNLTYEEKKLFYSENIKSLTSLEAENRNAMSNLEADGVNKSSEKWIDHEAVSKTYRDAIVWNQIKLDELNSMQEAIQDIVIAESRNLKAPVEGEEYETAMSEIGLNEAQIEYVRNNPEMQTYYAMTWKEKAVDTKIGDLEDQKENYIAEASGAFENSNTTDGSDVEQLSGQEAIVAYNKSEMYNTEAIVWYEKADSINLIINALEDHKKNLVANREAFHERMDEDNRIAIADIESGKPLAIEDDVIIAEVDVPVVEDNEPLVEDSELEFIEDPDTGDGFMIELGTSFYSQQEPIPVDPPLPTGVIFKVQIGAFRNPIPAEHFIGLSPMTAEKLNNGITRYTVGIFYEMQSARNARSKVQNLGYNDAFIVAFLNGERIPLNRALSMLGIEPQAESESLAANDQTASESADNNEGTSNSIARNSSTDNNTNANTSKPIDVDGDTGTEMPTGYYNAPNAAPATEVESTVKLFYTVQVGVYSKPVSLADIYNVQPLNVERTGLGYTRYTSGQFTDILDAETHKVYVINQGILDAFITAYYQGKRISIAKAQTIMLTEPQAVDDAISPFSFEESDNKLEIDSVDDIQVLIPRESPLVRDEIVRNAEAKDLRYVIFLGSYQEGIPNEVASALLENSEAGIKKAINQGNTIYSSREMRSMYEAEEWLGRFREAGVDAARIIYVVSGEEITLEQAKAILDK